MLTDQHYLDYVEQLLHLPSEELLRYAESPTAEWEDFYAWASLPEKKELLHHFLLQKAKEIHAASDTATNNVPAARRCNCCIRSRSRKLADYID